MTVPVLPVVMAQAEIASVADKSWVATPPTVMVVEFGVCMYHCPLAPAVGTNNGSSGIACG